MPSELEMLKGKGLVVRPDKIVEVRTTFLLDLDDAIKMVKDMEKEGIKRTGTYLRMLIKKRLSQIE